MRSKLALRYAIRSDVGLLREGNEDAAYAGPRLLAVADGTDDHAAGEAASATPSRPSPGSIATCSAATFSNYSLTLWT